MFESFEKTESELHLVIVWFNGREMESAVAADLATRFEVLAHWSLEWSPSCFAKNLRRFYGKKLPPKSSKERECGIGPFALFIVRDSRPVYSPRKTTHGVQIVNANMFDSKEMYRAWAKQNVIHATNSPEEFRHDITLLLGISPEDLERRHFIRPDGSEQPGFDIVGCRQWKDVRQLLHVLNNTLNYVVLRNFDNLPDHADLGPHSDLDILTDEPEIAALLLNARPTTSVRGRVQHRVQVGGSFLNVDIRRVGDGYYDARWERDILQNRVFRKEGFYTPADGDLLYALVYHALLQKRTVAEDYPGRILALCRQLGCPPLDLRDEASSLERLKAFMAERHYVFTDPADPSVTFNYFKVGAKSRFLRKRQRAKRKIKALAKAVLRRK
jgi:hypothetical protein